MIRLLILLAALLPGLVIAAEAKLPEDPRTLVEMPLLQQALMRQDMVEHLSALNNVLGFLAAGKLKEAAAIAEKELGVSSMGKHAAATGGQGPGRFMPEAMRGIGLGMHQAASEFAEVAKKGNKAAAYRALEPVTAACAACHSGFRIR
ncbi:MAG: cytochrome c [Hydrogenophilaceae bacterium]|nr:cytochrome c [Hydrogenophilaceae bacterium]